MAKATRRAVRAWNLEILCKDPKCYSPVLTAIMMPAGMTRMRSGKIVLEHFDMSLGQGLSKIAGKVFRIGHLGDTNDLTMMGALSGVEMGLQLAGVPHKKGGAQAAMDYLAESAKTPMVSVSPNNRFAQR
jgi:alanine-glyoxylate transaminase/serine-glyoxylate transaminase/serine-pyruvate transaminase